MIVEKALGLGLTIDTNSRVRDAVGEKKGTPHAKYWRSPVQSGSFNLQELPGPSWQI